MVIQELVKNFFLYANKLSAEYGVNYSIFITIYLFFTPSYYWGAFLVAKDIIVFHKESRNQKLKPLFHDFILRNKFIIGFTINRLSWLAPYIYVIFAGYNLPLRIYLLIWGWLFVSLYIFVHNLRKKVLV